MTREKIEVQCVWGAASISSIEEQWWGRELGQLVVCAWHVSGRICDKLVPSVISEVSPEGWSAS